MVQKKGRYFLVIGDCGDWEYENRISKYLNHFVQVNYSF